MRRLITWAVVAGLLGVTVARAAPTLVIRGAAARVVVIPEARGDIAVFIERATPGLPLKIRRLGDRVTITGNVARRVRGCFTVAGRQSVRVWSRGAVAYEALPKLVVHAPMDLRLTAGDAVFGEIGRSTSLDLTNQGCGDWTVANVAGRMRIDQAGAGVTRAGTARSADLSVAGSGKVITQPIAGGVTAVSSGAGDIKVSSINGPYDVRVAGAGTIVTNAGLATSMTASIAGSGAIRFGGTALNLQAMIAGPGQVRVDRVTGSVSKRVFGSGSVTVGR